VNGKKAFKFVSAIVPQFTDAAEASALFDYVQKRIRYVKDVVGVETISDPLTTLNRMVGDCDDKATLLATLLESVGYPTRFVMAGYHGSAYEHVYLQAFMHGHWVSMDACESQPMGWEPPDPTSYWLESVT
jgi:transglutaminase-like putative cysteine protease